MWSPKNYYYYSSRSGSNDSGGCLGCLWFVGGIAIVLILGVVVGILEGIAKNPGFATTILIPVAVCALTVLGIFNLFCRDRSEPLIFSKAPRETLQNIGLLLLFGGFLACNS